MMGLLLGGRFIGGSFAGPTIEGCIRGERRDEWRMQALVVVAAVRIADAIW